MSTDVIGKHSFLDTPDVNGVLVLLNAGNTPSVSADTAANRPAAGIAGRLFIDTTNNTLQRDTGSSWVTIGSSYPYVLSKSAATTTVSGTIAETNLISFTIPGGVMGTDGVLALNFGGNIANNSGANRTVRVRIYLGATLMYDDTSAAMVTGASYPLVGRLVLNSNSSASSQRLTGTLMIGGGPATTGLGDLATDEIISTTPLQGTAAVDTSTDQTFRITVTHSNASASLITTNNFYIAIKE
jgi:hypothetical protein